MILRTPCPSLNFLTVLMQLLCWSMSSTTVGLQISGLPVAAEASQSQRKVVPQDITVLVMKLVTTLEQITTLRSTALLVGMDMLISFSQQVIQSILATEQSLGTSMMATTIG